VALGAAAVPEVVVADVVLAVPDAGAAAVPEAAVAAGRLVDEDVSDGAEAGGAVDDDDDDVDDVDDSGASLFLLPPAVDCTLDVMTTKKSLGLMFACATVWSSLRIFPA